MTPDEQQHLIRLAEAAVGALQNISFVMMDQAGLVDADVDWADGQMATHIGPPTRDRSGEPAVADRPQRLLPAKSVPHPAGPEVAWVVSAPLGLPSMVCKPDETTKAGFRCHVESRSADGETLRIPLVEQM